MVKEKKPRKKWFGKTLLIVCSCLFLLTFISYATTDKGELLLELSDTESALVNAEQELSRTKRELEDATGAISTLLESERKLQSELGEAKGSLAEAKVELEETESQLVITQSELHTANSSSTLSSNLDSLSDLGDVPDFTFQVGAQVGMLVGFDIVATEHQSAQLCEEATLPIVTDFAEELLKTPPPEKEEEKHLYFVAAYTASVFNGQYLLNTNQIDCDIATPLSDMLSTLTEAEAKKEIQNTESDLVNAQSELQATNGSSTASVQGIETKTVSVDGVVLKLAKETIYESPIKTQIDQRWYVTAIPESEDVLEKILQELHKKALEPRKTFINYNPANAIYIYVYYNKETTEDEVWAAHWLGMSSKSASDSTNEISISSHRLAKQLQPSEVRHGLEEPVRKKIWLERLNGVKQAWEKAEQQFPNDLEKQVELIWELEEELDKKLSKQYGISEDQLIEISVEGSFEGFH